MDKSQRRVLLPALVLLIVGFCLLSCRSWLAFVAPRQLCNPGQLTWRGTVEHGLGRTALSAKGDDEEDDDDSVEVSGFSGFLIGIAMLPHVSYALYTCFNVLVKGEAFALGPYGLELISCFVSVGLVMWSIGSFFLRGKGLPAGPLGLLGLSEGLSYLAALGLGVAAVVVSVKNQGPSQAPPVAGAPKVTQVSAPSAPSAPAAKAPAPAAKAPDAKPPSSPAPSMPAVSAPEVKMPDFKMPDFGKDLKMPDIKAPEVKIPEIKAPDAPKQDQPKKEEAKKAEEPKKEAKKEEPKKDAPKKEEPKKEEPKKEEPKKEAPKKEDAPKPTPPAPKKEEVKPAAAVDYDSLFD